MTTNTHLWAIGYDDMARADQVRDEITNLGWGSGRAGKYLLLDDIAVVVRHSDGSFTFDREPFPGGANVLACTAVQYCSGTRRKLIPIPYADTIILIAGITPNALAAH